MHAKSLESCWHRVGTEQVVMGTAAAAAAKGVFHNIDPLHR